MSDLISPYSWQEILDRFPLDYHNWVSIPEAKVPPGRVVRDLDDKAGQYGDLLQHGDTIVRVPGNVIFFSTTATSSTASYTVAGLTSGTDRITFTIATSSGGH